MGETSQRTMDRKAELTARFNKIDVNSNGKLEKSELASVFGEYADEFLKFCDDGEKDGVLTADEFCAGIEADTKDLSDDDFKAAWLGRMDGCIADAAADPKNIGKLTYFGGIRSRGEPCRMVATYGGLTFEDEQLSFDEWGARKSDDIPFMPYITHPDGTTLFETVDVLKFLAEKGGEFVVDDATAALAAKCNSPPLFIVDPYLNMPPPVWEQFGLPPREEYAGSVAPVLKELAAELGDKPFFAGDKPGYGEAFFFHNLDNMMLCCKAEIVAAVADEAVMA